jgi:hypothetical protein
MGSRHFPKVIELDPKVIQLPPQAIKHHHPGIKHHHGMTKPPQESGLPLK